MDAFTQIRIKIKRFIGEHSVWFERGLRAVLTLILLSGIKTYFNYSDKLDSLFIVIVLVVLCAFLSYGTMSLIITLFLLGEIFSLSLQGGLITTGLLLTTYAFCRIFMAKQYLHIPGIPVFYQMHLTFLLPTEAALFGEYSEVVPLIGGTTVAFYLKQLRDNSAALTDGSDTVTPFSLLTGGVLQNQLFILYLLSIIALFSAISILRRMPIKFAGQLSVVFGILIEFIIMLSGYLMFDSRDRIPNLIICNLISLAIGLISSYLVMDLDYSRVEKVKFEDDDYTYYVMAVPKVKIADDQKEVKKITHRSSK